MAPPTNTLTIGVRILTYKLVGEGGWDTNIQTVVNRVKFHAPIGLCMTEMYIAKMTHFSYLYIAIDSFFFFYCIFSLPFVPSTPQLPLLSVSMSPFSFLLDPSSLNPHRRALSLLSVYVYLYFNTFLYISFNFSLGIFKPRK